MSKNSACFRRCTISQSQRGAAYAFLDACETGEGWEVCQDWCHFNATLSYQEELEAKVITLALYTDWMKELLSRTTEQAYILKSLTIFSRRTPVTAVAKFYGSKSLEGGPVPPAQSSIVSEYTYIMEFYGDKICHLTKVWSDIHAVRDIV